MPSITYQHDGTDWRMATDISVHTGPNAAPRTWVRAKRIFTHDGTRWRLTFANDWVQHLPSVTTTGLMCQGETDGPIYFPRGYDIAKLDSHGDESVFASTGGTFGAMLQAVGSTVYFSRYTSPGTDYSTIWSLTEGGTPVSTGLTTVHSYNSRSLKTCDGVLYALARPGSTAYVLHSYNGSAWTSLGISIDGGGIPGAWNVIGGTVYSIRYTGFVGGFQRFGVFRWGGASWAAVGADFKGAPTSIILHDGALHISHTDAVYRWTGSTWATVGSLTGAQHITSANGVLSVSVYAYPRWYVAKLVGTTWETIGSDLIGISAMPMLLTEGTLFVMDQWSGIYRWPFPWE